MTKHTERLQRYLDRLGRARQHDHEHIHGFDAGEPTEALLLASDIQAAINQVKELETQPTVEPVAWRWSESGGERWFGWTTDWAHHDRAEKLGYPIEYAYAAPTTKAEPAPTVSGKWLTIVYKDIEPGGEAVELGSHPKVSAMSWSHAMDARAALLHDVSQSPVAAQAPPADALDAGWIDVDTRLPGEQGQDSEEVLLFLNGNCTMTDFDARQGGGWGIRLGYFDAERQAFRVHGRPDSSVTHWQPLPAAPAIDAAMAAQQDGGV